MCTGTVTVFTIYKDDEDKITVMIILIKHVIFSLERFFAEHYVGNNNPSSAQDFLLFSFFFRLFCIKLKLEFTVKKRKYLNFFVSNKKFHNKH